MASKSYSAVGMTAEEKQSKMSEERAFLTKFLESALAGKTDQFMKYTLEYSSTHSIPPHEVVSQFKDGSERNALHFACQSQPSKHHEHNEHNQADDTDEEEDIVVHILTQSQFPTSAVSNLLRSKDKDGLTPLMLACQSTHPSSHKRIQCILTLSDQTAKAKSQTGATALHYASAAGASPQTITTLYRAAPTAVRTNSLRGGTPLHWASGVSPPANYVETLKALVGECAADVDAKNEDGISALILAAAAGNDKHMKVLVENGADRGVVLGGGVTVYHIAADLNLVGALSAMMAADMADEAKSEEKTETVGQKCLRMKNDKGETPLDLAVQEGHVGCVMLLMNEADEKVARAYIQEGQNKLKGKMPQSLPVEDKKLDDDKSAQSTSFKSKIDAIGAFEEQAEKSAQEFLNTTRADGEMHELALQRKTEGNAHFAKREYTKAIECYTDAIQKNPCDATFYSNRSACYMAVKDFDKALHDAILVRTIRSDWPKGFYRVAVARLALERFDDAAQAAWGGVQLDSENDELKSLLQKCVKQGRKDHFKKSTSNASNGER